MTKTEMANRYAGLARRRTEILLQSGSRPELEQEERIILQEMAALETAMRLPIEEEKQIPEMLTIKEAAGRTGLSYDFIRKLCLQGKSMERSTAKAGNGVCKPVPASDTKKP